MASKLLQRLRVKNPAELTQKVHQAFVRVPYESSQDRIVEELSKLLSGMKDCMFGEDEDHCSKENALIIAREACRTELISEMVDSLGLLSFEARKDVVQIFGAIVRIEDGGHFPGLDYLLTHPEVVPSLFDDYDRPETALICGQMFRECVRHEPIAAGVLNSDLFPELFAKLSASEFEVASDAFITFKDLLTRHKAAVAAYLTEHYTDFLQRYQELLTSPNYVTRRQAVKLLGELLLDRANMKIMFMYVADVGNLRLMMNLLKDSSKSIQFEAFHVFKVFVANPNKTRPIMDVLLNNRDKLLKYLEDFQTDREEEQFKEEKAIIVKEIADLKPVPEGTA